MKKLTVIEDIEAARRELDALESLYESDDLDAGAILKVATAVRVIRETTDGAVRRLTNNGIAVEAFRV